MIDLIVRYRWTALWAIYVAYCIGVYQFYEAIR